MTRTSACLAMVLAAAGAAGPPAGHAVTTPPPETKIQSFKLDTVGTPAFIDFDRLVGRNGDATKKALGRVKFKSKAKSAIDKGNDADFKLGTPFQSSAGKPGSTHQVDIELVSLSLVSVNPIALDVFGDDGKGRTEQVFLRLDTSRSSGARGDVTYDEPGNKTGKFDVGFDAFFKLETKDKLKRKAIKKLPLSATGVSFSQQSPITIAAPFCMDAGDTATLCLSPISASASEPGTLALLFVSVGAVMTLVTLGGIRTTGPA